MANTSEKDSKKNRYPGVKPFMEQDYPLFFGRKTDLDDLSRRIFIRQTVVLYGKSGYGKSSLINAGIIPNLKKMDSWTYFSIRFSNYSEKEIIKGLTPAQTVKNRFSENIKVDTTSAFHQMLPTENSFWYWIKQNQLVHNKNKFIIFFDQFEELFNDSKENISDFSEQLAELLYGTIPINYKDKLNELVKNKPVNEKLQQFIYEKPEIKVVFSIRADRLSLMNILTDRHPTILQYHYELDALNIPDATMAITEPAKLENGTDFKTPPFTYHPLAITKILEGIANKKDKKIEAAALQIVCRYVEDVLVDEQKNVLITEDILGEINDIYQQYYQNTLNKLAEEERPKIRCFIEDELIDGDRRNTLTVGFIKNRLGITTDLLDVLEQSSLLRKEIDAGGRLIYEISHDSLVAPINKMAGERRDQEAKDRRQQEEQKLEQQKLADEKQKEEERLLLAHQLAEEKRRSDLLKQLNDKARISLRMAVVLAIVCLGIAVVAIYFKNMANKDKKKADDEKAIAESQQHNAELNLYRNNLYQAGDCINKAEIFMQSNDNVYARTELKHADSLTSSDKFISFKRTPLPVKLNDTITQKHHIIDSLLKKLK